MDASVEVGVRGVGDDAASKLLTPNGSFKTPACEKITATVIKNCIDIVVASSRVGTTFNSGDFENIGIRVATRCIIPSSIVLPYLNGAVFSACGIVRLRCEPCRVTQLFTRNPSPP